MYTLRRTTSPYHETSITGYSEKTFLLFTLYNQLSLQARMMKESKESSRTFSGQQVKLNMSLETRVLYKRDNSSQWQGPWAVIGQVSQQVFMKYGSFHICIHLCRTQLIKPALRTTDFPSSQTSEPDQTENPTSHGITPLQCPKILITLAAQKTKHQETNLNHRLKCHQTVVQNTAHNNTTTDNKTTWSHHLQQIALYCPHIVKLLLIPM